MSVTLQAVEADALKLTPDERSELIERLIASVEPALPLHPDWEAEIARRVAEMDAAGEDGLIPGEQVMAEMRARIAGLRRKE